MEFDVESFMSDVTAALSSQQSRGPEVDGDHEAAFDDFLQYPSDECGNTPIAARSSRRSSVQSVELLDSNKRVNGFEDQSDFRADGPTFLDLGMTNVHDSRPFSVIRWALRLHC